MTENPAIIALATLLSVMGLWFILFALYRDWRTDVFRQEMFALRDELFDFAASGEIRFDDPAYGLLRMTMNGFIRFAHKISLFQIFVYLLTKPSAETSVNNEQSFNVRWEHNTAILNSDLQLKLYGYRIRMEMLMIRHIIGSSPLLTITVLVPIFSYVGIKYCFERIAKILTLPINSIDSAAMAFGRP